MSQILIVDLNPASVNLLNLSLHKPDQIRGGFGAAPPVGEDGLPLIDRPKRDFEPIKVGGRLLLPQ